MVKPTEEKASGKNRSQESKTWLKKSRGGKSARKKEENQYEGVQELLVEFDCGSHERYVLYNEKVYTSTGDEVNKTMNQLITRATDLGYKITTYNSSQAKNYREARKKERKKAEKILDEQWVKAAPRPRKGMKGH